MKFEYKIVRADFDDRADTLKNDESRLWELGAEGWELVTVLPLAFNGAGAPILAAYYFKRQKQQ
jgi:hypothetical protein